jgi:hypothetical protein
LSLWRPLSSSARRSADGSTKSATQLSPLKGSQEDPVSVARPLAEPGPERPATQWQERKTKTKRTRPPSLNDQRTQLSRGPSGLPHSGKSGKRRRNGCDTTGHLSMRALRSRSRFLQGFA